MEYLTRMKTIQDNILGFLDAEEDQCFFDDLSKLLSTQQNQTDKHELKSILYLISKISDNHHRTPFFFEKIKRIFNLLKNDIVQLFSNIEIFNIFQNNKRILLLLIDENIITFDHDISTRIDKYKNYFYLELNKLNEDVNPIEIPENYEEKRTKGENDFYFCELIRNDNVEEFIVNYTRTGLSLSKTIEPSIYETNSFLENKNPTLIEYAAFFGSIQIFRFLFQNQVRLNQSLWIYAIHGGNPDIIHFLEENKIEPQDQTFQKCLEESIKCHHNDFALYFKNNFISESNVQPKYDENEISYAFHYYNFQFIPIELKEPFFFFYSIEYDHYKLVEYFKDIEGLNFNETIIQTHI